MSNQDWSDELCIPSDSSAGKQVNDQLIGKLSELGWMDDDIFGVHLAVEEAVVNAIKHGNQNDSSKQVQILYQTTDSHLRVEITDEGEGFQPCDVPDPTEEENLELPSGRGLMLMRSFMSSVEFNERGNQVIMTKRRGEENEEE